MDGADGFRLRDGSLLADYFPDEEKVSYVVVENTPGYMPDDEPFFTDDYSQAVEYLNDRAKEYEDDESGVYTVEYGIASCDNLAAVLIHDSSKSHDLGRYIAVEIDHA